MTDDQHISHDDLAAYLLGGLDERESAGVESHVDACERCQADVRWLRPAMEILPEAVEQLEPPPELRDRLLDITRADAEYSGAATRTTPVRDHRIGFGRFKLGRLPAFVVVLQLVMVAVAVGVGYGLDHGGGSGGSGGSGGDTRTVAIASKAPGSMASLEISDDSAILQAHNVPMLPAGSVYQVWVALPGQGVKPSSVFRPTIDGTAVAAVPEVLHGAEQVMITAEPRKGSSSPSSAPIYSARVTS